MQLAKPLNLTIQVGQIPFNTILKAGEIIICNSLYTVFQVTAIHHGEQTYTWKSQPLAAKIKALITC